MTICWTPALVEDRLIHAVKNPGPNPKAPFNHHVPHFTSDYMSEGEENEIILENLAFRRAVLELSRTDTRWRRILWEMCKRDPLFYVNLFVWTFDPRLEDCKKVPLVLFAFQETALLGLLDAIREGSDIVGLKSRDELGSWMTLIAFDHQWKFFDNMAFGLVSRTQDLVDKKNDPDCLMWKLDFIREHQPNWLGPGESDVERTALSIHNKLTRSTMTGAASVSDVNRGGRKTAIGMDEFSKVEDSFGMLKATRDATRCRIFIFTPNGTGNAAHTIWHKTKGFRKFTLHWSQDPRKNKGLYRWDEEKKELVILDKHYVFPRDFEFRRDGKLRSPWYDHECDRAAHPMEIAQELDMDFLGSDFQFYHADVVRQLMAEYCCEPTLRGELIYDNETCEPIRFEKHPKGRLLLWINLVDDGSPNKDVHYAVGADVSAGTGSSNSTLSFACVETREKVAAWADPNTPPEEFGDLAVAMCLWFGEAQLNPEVNGPGEIFIRRVMNKRRYRKVRFRRRENQYGQPETEEPGFFSTPRTKYAALGDYRAALKDRRFINRDREAMEETLEYVDTGRNKVVHSRSRNKVDPTGAEDNHGDRVIADAMCSMLVDELAGRVDEVEEESDPDNVLERWRREDDQEELDEDEMALPACLRGEVA